MDENNQNQPQPTDPLQPQNDAFNPVQDEPKLPEDNTPPAAPADDVQPTQPPVNSPATDTDVDQDETYQEGLGQASGVDEHGEGNHEGPSQA